MIELKYFEHSDFQQLINWVETPEFIRQWGGSKFSYPLDEAQLEDYLKEANSDDSNIYIYSVIEKETGKMIGHISLGNIDRKNKSSKVGKVLVGDKNVRGRGVGQQMITEILKVAFDELSLHRVSLTVFDFNTPAIACYEKAGFIKEGVFREAIKIDDAYYSLSEMSMLENEWMKLNQQ